MIPDVILFVSVFCVMLFVYLHVQFHFKVSCDRDVYELNEGEFITDEMCHMRQPILCKGQGHSLASFGLTQWVHLYPDHLIQMENQTRMGSTDADMSVPLVVAHALLTNPQGNTQEKPLFQSRRNASFLQDTKLAKDMMHYEVQNRLRPPFTLRSYYDVWFGSKQATTPFQMNMYYRNHYVVTRGSVWVRLLPPHKDPHGTPYDTVYDYDRFEFRLSCDQHNQKPIDVLLQVGDLLVIPAYWWYSFEWLESQSMVAVFQYQTYMNTMAILPHLVLYGLQHQNMTVTYGRKHVAPVAPVAVDQNQITEEKEKDVNEINEEQQDINKQEDINKSTNESDSCDFGSTGQSNCIPNDVTLDPVLVPFECVQQRAFSKHVTNEYVTICVNESKDKDKDTKETTTATRPSYCIHTRFGSTDDLNAYAQYRLCCKHILHSIQSLNQRMNQQMNQQMNQINKGEDKDKDDKKGEQDQQQDYPIISMDPEGCVDIDDAVTCYLDGITGHHHVCIYISCVTLTLDRLGLITELSDRVATLYLPDPCQRRPMLPSVLSDQLCSLLAGEVRPALMLHLCVDRDGSLVSLDWSVSSIVVQTNYAYEEPRLLSNPMYQSLLTLVRLMNTRLHCYMESITDSHDVVQWLMLCFNHQAALVMAREYQSTSTPFLFRVTIPKKEANQVTNQTETESNQLNNGLIPYVDREVGQYQLTPGRHASLNVDCYTHMSSPIRRLPDLLNLFLFVNRVVNNNNTTKEKEDIQLGLVQRWLNEASVQQMNDQMRWMRKIEKECILLSSIAQNRETNGDMGMNVQGTIYPIRYENENESNSKTKGKGNMYVVHIPTLQMWSQVEYRGSPDELPLTCSLVIYTFTNEARLKRKIRIQMKPT